MRTFFIKASKYFAFLWLFILLLSTQYLHNKIQICILWSLTPVYIMFIVLTNSLESKIAFTMQVAIPDHELYKIAIEDAQEMREDIMYRVFWMLTGYPLFSAPIVYYFVSNSLLWWMTPLSLVCFLFAGYGYVISSMQAQRLRIKRSGI